MLNHTKRKLTATGIMCLMLTAASTTAYGAAPALQTAAVSTQAVQNSVEDPTLGGLFELYTPAEYEETINQIKKYMGANHADVKAMETTIVSFNPTIVMRPELAKSAEELTAENYKKDIEDVTKLLDQAVKDKTVTPEQKESILKKMNENLAKLN